MYIRMYIRYCYVMVQISTPDTSNGSSVWAMLKLKISYHAPTKE